MIDLERRRTLKTGGSIALLGLFATLGIAHPAFAGAAKKSIFEAKSLDDLLDAMGVGLPASSDFIQLTAPEVAENGAFVPVTITSKLPRTEQISILVEKNPNTLTANFILPEGTEGFITTRIKMGQTDNLIALVKADGKFYRVSRVVKVTLGGCS